MTLLQAGRDLLARGGVPELYQGLGVTLIGSMPAVGVYFGLYQFVKKQMDAMDDMSPYISITVSAGVGNFIARCVLMRVPCFRCSANTLQFLPADGCLRLPQPPPSMFYGLSTVAILQFRQVS